METSQTKFPHDFQTQLSTQLVLKPFETTVKTPFSLLRVADTSIILHCIDFETYTKLQPQIDFRSFFQQLSERFLVEEWQLIHLWEDVWRQRPEIVRSRLRALVGISERIPARLTQVRRIDKPTTGQFLQENHLQVVTHSKYKYGLFLPARYFRILSPAFQAKLPNTTELLVAVATFSHPRQITRNGISHRSVELVRFANKLNVTVVGGLDKLLKAFVTDIHPDDIMTYADRDWSNGRSYEKLGFTRVQQTEPNQFWVRPGDWIRYNPTHLPDGLPETEMPANGYIPVYNSGSVKFVKIL